MAIAVIDPEHGGISKVGGSSPQNSEEPNGFLEKMVTLDIAHRVCSALERLRVAPWLNRSIDENLGLRERRRVVKNTDADAFVSIQFNGFDGAVRGTETRQYEGASIDSKSLATLVQAVLRTVTGYRRVRTTSRRESTSSSGVRPES